MNAAIDAIARVAREHFRDGYAIPVGALRFYPAIAGLCEHRNFHKHMAAAVAQGLLERLEAQWQRGPDLFETVIVYRPGKELHRWNC